MATSKASTRANAGASARGGGAGRPAETGHHLVVARPARPSITPEQAASITDAEMAFSTDRLLPAWEEIPEEFVAGNLYTRVAEAVFYDVPLPDAMVTMQEGFAPETLNRVIRSHLASFGPKHQHKIAGVGYLISQMATLRLRE